MEVRVHFSVDDLERPQHCQMRFDMDDNEMSRENEFVDVDVRLGFQRLAHALFVANKSSFDDIDQ